MDLVTVTCTRDKEEMILQAHSLDIFAINNIKHWVIVEDNLTTMEEWHNLLGKFYTRHKLILLKGHDTSIENGWVKQQLYKLTIANHIKTDSYLILDSLLCLIKPVNFLDWPIEHGNGDPVDSTPNKIHFDRCWTDFIQSYTSKYQLSIPTKLYYPLVPFRMNTELSKKIIHDNLEEKIKNFSIISEFLIYQFYANHFDVPLHEVRNNQAIIIWENANYPVNLNCLIEADYKFFGINRYKLKADRNKISLIGITNFLSSLGLNKTLVKNYIQNLKYINY